MTKAGSAWPVEEIIHQIEFTRKSPEPGYVLWHLGTLAANPALQNKLASEVYSAPTVVPAVRSQPAPNPVLSASKLPNGKTLLRWSLPAAQKPSHWVLQTKRGNIWQTEILSAANTSREVEGASEVAVSAVSRFRVVTTASGRF